MADRLEQDPEQNVLDRVDPACRACGSKELNIVIHHHHHAVAEHKNPHRLDPEKEVIVSRVVFRVLQNDGGMIILILNTGSFIRVDGRDQSVFVDFQIINEMTAFLFVRQNVHINGQCAAGVTRNAPVHKGVFMQHNRVPFLGLKARFRQLRQKRDR